MSDSETKALDKIDIASELKTLSPIEKQSLELRELAETTTITDKVTYQEAKRVRRELVSHRNVTKELRLTFTRKLDNLKDQFIKKQDEVLEAALVGEDIIKVKIANWEKVEREKKEAEEKRMAEILDRFKTVYLDVRKATLDDVRKARAYIKAERSLLEPNDRNKVAVKLAIAEYTKYLDECEDLITQRVHQEAVEREQEEERQRLEAERAKIETERTEVQERIDQKSEEIAAEGSKKLNESPLGLKNQVKAAQEHTVDSSDTDGEEFNFKVKAILTGTLNVVAPDAKTGMEILRKRFTEALSVVEDEGFELEIAVTEQ